MIENLNKIKKIFDSGRNVMEYLKEAVVNNIPCLLSENAIVATHFLD